MGGRKKTFESLSRKNETDILQIGGLICSKTFVPNLCKIVDSSCGNSSTDPAGKVFFTEFDLAKIFISKKNETWQDQR